jgi:septal ring-binding cell division protein DamX
VRRAVRDSEFYRPRSGAQKIRIGAAALAAGLVLGWGTHVLLSIGAPTASSGSQPPLPVGSAPPSSASRALPSAPAVAALAPAEPPKREGVSQPIADAPARKPLPPAQGELAKQRFEATQEWLRSTPGDRYAIQLATVNSAELAQLEDFLRKASASLPADELLVYSVKIDGKQHYRVAYGSFSSGAEALQAIRGLPRLLAAYQPYPRSVERMRSQNRQ